MSSGQPSLAVIEENTSRRDGDGGGEAVPNAMSLILDIPGNRTCADCSSTGQLDIHTHNWFLGRELTGSTTLCLQWWSGPA